MDHTLPRRVVGATLVLVSLSCLAGCGSDDTGASTPNALTIATPAEPDALLPPLIQSTQGKQTADLIFDHLAEAGEHIETVGDGGFRPQLAERWDWASDSLSIAFHIDPRARWHDGRPVRAEDVRFSFALYRDSLVASPHASAFDGIDSVTARDTLTTVAWWSRRHPEQFFQIAYNLAVMPKHLLDTVPRTSLASSAFASHPVGSGPYRFETWTPKQSLIVTAQPDHYRGAPAIGRVIWIVTADPTAASMSVLAGQADVLEQVKGDAYAETKRSDVVAAVEYGSLDYGYMAFNFAPHGSSVDFSDRRLRIALTAAIDREAIVQNALDSLGAVALGPFTRAESSVDTTIQQIAHDSSRAAALLDSLGWSKRNADGVRTRAGVPMAFELILPATSLTRGRLAILLQEQLRRHGVAVKVSPLEPAIFFARVRSGQFDAALNLWRADPSPLSIRHLWGSVHGRDAGMNVGRYANRAFDASLDSAEFSFDAKVRRGHLQRAYRTIVDDAAAIWLYEPRNFAAINRRVHPVGVRADAWWAALPKWTIGGAQLASARSR